MPVYNNESIEIRDVWKYNLDAEFALIRGLVDDYPYVAMDTEFPGIVYRDPHSTVMFDYNSLKQNVNMTKLIQLGLTFSDANGRLPTCGTNKHCVWQFNFCDFNQEKDAFFEASIDLLRESGIDFKRNLNEGVEAVRFGELLMSSGAVLNDDMHWITFHGAADFGYLLKILTGKNLPETPAGYFELIKVFFPVVYDIKYMINSCPDIFGGLDNVARMLSVERVGAAHLAGPDSLLTSCTFMKLREEKFPGSLEKYAGVVYGVTAELGFQ